MSDHERGVHLKIREHVAQTVMCRRCGTELDAQDVYVLGRREEYWCIAVSCPRCMHQGVLFLRAPITDRTTEVIELTDEEWERFADLPPLDETDANALRSALHEFRNDISELWEDE